MPYTLDNYLQELNQADRLYLANWVIPYSAAYVEAHRNFRQTLDDQRKYDQMMTDVAIMAFSICIGAGMASLMAKAGVATARQMVFNRALQIVCNRNLDRVFNVMHGAATSPAASYIAGQVWTQVQTRLAQATKTRVTSLLNPSPLLTDSISDPLVARDNLRRYCVLATAAAHTVAADLQQNDQLTDDEKNATAAQLREAPLIQQMPASSAVPANAAQMMELNMYMALILNNDMEEVTTGGGGWGGARTETTRSAIAVPPSHPDYPEPYNNNRTYGEGFNTGMSIDNRVIRFRLGDRIWGRINSLNQALFQRPFYRITAMTGNIGTYTEVVRAENVSRELQRLVFPQIARDAR